MRNLIAAAIMAACAMGTANAAPVTYTLDPAHTQVAFSIDRFGFTNVLGRFDTAAGEVVLDQEHPANSHVHAVVQIASVNTGDDTRNTHVRGPLWLNADQFATMEFTSTAVTLTGANDADVVGNLTLLGQSHPLTLHVHLNKLGESPANHRQSAGFSATGALSRAAWGSTTAHGLIGDQVNITIEALAEVQPAAQP